MLSEKENCDQQKSPAQQLPEWRRPDALKKHVKASNSGADGNNSNSSSGGGESVLQTLNILREANREMSSGSLINRSVKSTNSSNSSVLQEICNAANLMDEPRPAAQLISLLSKKLESAHHRIKQLEAEAEDSLRLKTEVQALKQQSAAKDQQLAELKRQCEKKEVEFQKKEKQMLEILNQIEIIKQQDSSEIIRLKLELKKREQIITEMECQQASSNRPLSHQQSQLL